MDAQHARNITAPFLKKEQLTSDTWSFFFDKTKDPFTYFPGQYTRMILPNDSADDRGTSRFFTLSSSPLEDYFTITTRMIQSTFKKTLGSLQPGTQVTCFGPLGTFFLQETEESPLVFLAGGIGITPFYSMISYIFGKQLPFNITLLVSFSSVSEMLFYKELTTIAEKNQQIKVIYTVTRPEEKHRWDGETGSISDSLIRKYVPRYMKSIYYVVGPSTMVEGTKETLIRMGIPPEQILIENYPGY